MYTESLKNLVTLLNNHGIPHVVENAFNGYIVRFDAKRDVALHDMTYGHLLGLWESYGFDEDDGDVTGFLSAEDVLARLLNSEE